MYELTLAHLTSAEHERDLEADLRQRRIVKVSDAARRLDAANAAVAAHAVPTPRPYPAGGRVRTAGR
jgi:hypothetical protein